MFRLLQQLPKPHKAIYFAKMRRYCAVFNLATQYPQLSSESLLSPIEKTRRLQFLFNTVFLPF